MLHLKRPLQLCSRNLLGKWLGLLKGFLRKTGVCILHLDDDFRLPVMSMYFILEGFLRKQARALLYTAYKLYIFYMLSSQVNLSSLERKSFPFCKRRTTILECQSNADRWWLLDECPTNIKNPTVLKKSWRNSITHAWNSMRHQPRVPQREIGQPRGSLRQRRHYSVKAKWTFWFAFPQNKKTLDVGLLKKIYKCRVIVES